MQEATQELDFAAPPQCGNKIYRDARSFELVSTKAMPSGIILSTYKVAGPLKTG
jgi:hypothetical protein